MAPVDETCDETGVQSTAEHAADASLTNHPLLHRLRQQPSQFRLHATAQNFLRHNILGAVIPAALECGATAAHRRWRR